MENMKVSACVRACSLMVSGANVLAGSIETKTERGVYVHGITRPYGTLDEI